MRESTTKIGRKKQNQATKPLKKILSKGINQPPLPSDYPEYIERVESHLSRITQEINYTMRCLSCASDRLQSLQNGIDASISLAKVELNQAEINYIRHRSLLDSIFYAMELLDARTRHLEKLLGKPSCLNAN